MLFSLRKFNLVNYKTIHFLCFFVFALGLVGCHNQRKIASSKSTENKKNNKNATLIQNLDKSDIQYRTLVFKGKASHFDRSAESKQSFNYKMSFYKDSLIWISFHLFGIEGARALFTKDSIFFINRLEKSYFKSSINFIHEKSGYSITLPTLQKLLLGSLPSNLIKQIDYDVITNDKSIQITNRTKDSTELKINIDKFLYVLNNIKFTNKMVTTDLTMKQYESFSGKQIPYKTILNLSIPNSSITTLEHSKVIYNPSDVSFKFSIPSHYVPVKLF